MTPDAFPALPPLAIARVETFVLRTPIAAPVRTSFGIMRDRPALLLRLTDRDGVQGWGEVWCNFPAVGAEHRARLIHDTLQAPLLARPWPSPQACFAALTAHVRILAIQAGEPGPLAQAIAAIDMALWDIAGQRLGQPLWQLLGGQDHVAVYASGINPDRPLDIAQEKAAAGYTAFKLKIGFDAVRDLDNVRTLRHGLGDAATLMVDANQAWDLPQAMDMATALDAFGVRWLEEPLPADTPWQQWETLAAHSPVWLAGGENLRGDDAFDAATKSGRLRVIQPDMGKWGGFSGCLPVARQALARGHWFCPHWLGGGIGLLASMHLKAAVGGSGFVEVDANANPLREGPGMPPVEVDGGRVTLPRAPGLGAAPDLEALARYRVPVAGTAA